MVPVLKRSLPRPTEAEEEKKAAAVAAGPEKEDDVEDDRDQAFDEYWEAHAPRRQAVREKRKRLEAAPRTINAHFAPSAE